MKIWERIILGFITVVIIMIIVDVNALMNNIRIIDDIEDLEQSKRVELTQSNKIAYLVQRIKSSVRELFLEIEIAERPDEIELAKSHIEDSIPALNQAIQTMRNAILSDQIGEEGKDAEREKNELIKLDSLKSQTDEFATGIISIVELLDLDKYQEAESFFESGVEPASRDIQTIINQIVEDAEKEVAWALEQINLKVDKAIILGIYLTILSVLLSLAIGFYISKSISNPLHKLIYGTKEIRNGNLETSVNLHTQGELQELAESFNKMAIELKDRIFAINKLNEELKEANQTKDKFFSIIAHDLKNPFNAILGFSDLLVSQYNDFSEDERKNIIEELNKSSLIVYELLDNLLTWAMAQSNRIEIFPENIDLKPILEKSIDSQSGNIKQKNITMDNSIQDGTILYADKFTLTVVINNILNNAVKFTPDNGFISISATKNNNFIEICILDSGIGMSQAIIDNLFKSEKIESSPGTRDEKGTGLGLLLIKDFITKNNGYLSITSKTGKGTEFYFSLPAGK